MDARVELARLVVVDDSTTYAEVVDALDEIEAAWFALHDERQEHEQEVA